MINLIVTRSRNNVIGNKDGIPWRIKGEQKQFKELTTGAAVIMGRKTYQNIGHPLPDCLNIVVSNKQTFEGENLMTARSIKEAIDIAIAGDHAVYIAGGASIYKEAIPLVDRMYITEVDIDIPVDESTVFFPDFNKDEFEFYKGITDGNDRLKFTRTEYIRPESFPEMVFDTEHKQVVSLDTLNKALDEVFNEITGNNYMYLCGSCPMKKECPHEGTSSERYCGAKKFRYLVQEKIKKEIGE